MSSDKSTMSLVVKDDVLPGYLVVLLVNEVNKAVPHDIARMAADCAYYSSQTLRPRYRSIIFLISDTPDSLVLLRLLQLGVLLSLTGLPNFIIRKD